MYKLMIAGAAGLLMAASSVSALAAASAEECQGKFQLADTNKDGVLKSEEAKIYMDAIGKAEIKLNDASMITRDEFANACQKDAFAGLAPAATGNEQSTAQPSDGANVSTQQKTTDQAQTTDQTTDQQTASTSQQKTTDQAQTTDQQSASTSQQKTTDQAQTTDQTTDEQTASTSQPSTADQGTTSKEKALAVPKGYLASKLIGSTVFTKDDQSIGDINDLIVSSDNSTPDSVVIGIGGFLGMGEKDVVLDISRLSFVPTDNGGAKVVLDTTKSELEGMPTYNSQ